MESRKSSVPHHRTDQILKSGSSSVGVAIVGLDYRFLWASPGLCKLLKYEAHELVGRTFEAITHPDDIAIDSHLSDRLKRGQLTQYEIEKRYVDKSGAPVAIHLTASIVRERSGQPLYILALIELPQVKTNLAPDRVASHLTGNDVDRIRNAILM